MATREPIYAALAALVFADPRIGAVFATTGRYLRHHEQVPGGVVGMPAIYLVQHPGESFVRVGKGVPAKRTLRCAFVMYFNTADPGNSLPATACNAGLDVIDDVINLPPNPGNVQTLGGLVEHVYIEGDVSTAEGLLQDHSIVVVPITILIP
jgi:hypothetical protein